MNRAIRWAPVVGVLAWLGALAYYLPGTINHDTAWSLYSTGRWIDGARFYVDLVEINPMILTPDGRVHALDAKVTFDSNALFRHKQLLDLRDLSEEEPVAGSADSTCNCTPSNPFWVMFSHFSFWDSRSTTLTAPGSSAAAPSATT